MRKLALLLLAAPVLAGLLALGPNAPAHTQDKLPASPAPSPPLEEAGKLPEELRDSAFERYVDLRKLGDAIDDSNAELAADVALQLAEGERVLLRAHKAIAAKDALQLAIKLAGATRDTTTLKRLSEHARRSNNDALMQQLSQAQALAGAKRAIDPLLQASVDGTTTSMQFGFLKRIAQVLDRARLTGETSDLAFLIEDVKEAEPALLEPSRKQAVLKRLEDATAQAKSTPPDAQINGALDKLRKATRDLGPIRLNTEYFIKSAHTGKVLDVPNGSTAEGVGIQQYALHYGNNQKWIFTMHTYGTQAYGLMIKNVHTNKFVTSMGVNKNLVQNSAHVTDPVRTRQTFFAKIRPTTSPGLNAIIEWTFNYGATALDVPNGDMRSGVGIQLYAKTGADNQRWIITTNP